MKQRITVEQVTQLTDKQEEKLKQWWRPMFGDHFVVIDGRTICYVVNYYSGDIVTLGKRESFIEKSKCLPLLSIGQMVELLKDKEAFKSSLGYAPSAVVEFPNGWLAIDWYHANKKGLELCDILWEAIKNELRSN
ncbi:MAG TPA: hypothetical protein VEA37_13465 [Flavobacterium sp.]|nr:hypothetical protein [Flavobacterium sp.]